MISASLFHFTNSIDTIKHILNDNAFRASYNIESVKELYPGANSNFLYVPMVCFCDIPLKYIKRHSKRYGEYGIGLDKSWGKKNNINPLMYRVSKELDTFFKDIVDNTEILEKSLSGIIDPVHYTSVFNSVNMIKDRCIKLGYYWKDEMDGIKSNYIDREWRYIPTDADYRIENKNDEKTRQKINRDYFKIKPDYLKFEIGDIQHIIVPDSVETVKMLDIINNLILDDADKHLLMQKIVKLTSITKDF